MALIERDVMELLLVLVLHVLLVVVTREVVGRSAYFCIVPLG